MKLYKFFTVALVALSLASCADNNVEDYPNFLGAVNTAQGVTVSIAPTLSVEENAGSYAIPVEVTGNANGKVVVTFEVKEGVPTDDVDAAKEVVNYNITSKTINIPEGETVGYLELSPVWEQGVINNDCTFDLTIKSVEGGSIGSNATCHVTIVNVDNAYTMMCGNWTMTGVDRNGATVSYTINVATPDGSSDDYGSYLMGFGIFKQSDYLVPFSDFQYDEIIGEGTMKLAVGDMMSDGMAFNYGDPVGVAFPVCLIRTETGLTMNADITLTFDKDMNEIVFPEDCVIVGGLFGRESLEFTGYTVGQIGSIKMTR